MTSEIKADKWSPASGTAGTIGDSGDTFTVPTGVGLTVTDEVKTNKISPASGTAFTLGDSGDTFTVPAGATIANSGTATGFGEANNPSFFAYMDAHQAVSDNVNTKVAFNVIPPPLGSIGLFNLIFRLLISLADHVLPQVSVDPPTFNISAGFSSTLEVLGSVYSLSVV